MANHKSPIVPESEWPRCQVCGKIIPKGNMYHKQWMGRKSCPDNPDCFHAICVANGKRNRAEAARAANAKKWAEINEQIEVMKPVAKKPPKMTEAEEKALRRAQTELDAMVNAEHSKWSRNSDPVVLTAEQIAAISHTIVFRPDTDRIVYPHFREYLNS